MLIWIAIYLIGSFLWRALIPADEVPSTELQYLTIGLDLLGLICLIGLWIQISRERPPRIGVGLNGLFLFALLAGLGLFVIRISGGNQSTWTGHLTFEYRPRSDVFKNPVIPAAHNAANDTKTGSTTVEAAASASPSVVYRAFYAASKNGDDETMKTLISRGKFRALDFSDKKRADERNTQTLRKLLEQPLGPSDDTRNEKITDETATVECLNPKVKWYTRKFVKEDGIWKLTP
ncbi:MAG: hypothetical protein ABI999_08365 [Acidobacteriota bacterium]